MEITAQGLDTVLHALGEQVSALGARVEIVVIGGSALLALGLVTRPTRDVDVVALAQNGALRPARPLPAALREARDRVSRDFGLPRDWLNSGPYAMVDQGGGRQEADLRALDPSREELLEAARWSMTHDPSPGYRMVLEQALEHLGVDDADLDA